MTDVLSPEQVAGIRDRSLHGHLGVSPTSIVALCDTVDALRKRLTNLRHEQNRWVESDQAAMRREKKALQDVAALSEQLREAQDVTIIPQSFADSTMEIFNVMDEQIRRLTAVLRDGLSDELRSECERVALEYTTKVWDDQIDRVEAATIIEDEIGVIWLRALAEEESDG